MYENLRNVHGEIFILKDPCPIFSFFFHIFGDFCVTRKVIFFSLLMANFTAEKCSVWRVLTKTCLVMVTIIKGIFSDAQ